MLTTSQARGDVQRQYELGASCYMVKPDDVAELAGALEAIERHWGV